MKYFIKDFAGVLGHLATDWLENALRRSEHVDRYSTVSHYKSVDSKSSGQNKQL